MSWLSRLMHLWDGKVAVPPPSPAFIKAYEGSWERRLEFWRTVSDGEPELIGYRISPSRFGAPDWPTARRGYLIARRGDRVLLASDGLSDPFLAEIDDPQVNGFGLELVIDAPASVFPRFDSDTRHKVVRSWAYRLLARVAGEIPAMVGLLGELRAGDVSSVEGVQLDRRMTEQLPPAYRLGPDAVGAIIGGVSPGLSATIPDMPLSQVRIAPITLLTADELDRVRPGPDREAILHQILQTGLVNDPARPSVIAFEP